jgi:hypothetical protein
MVGSNREGTRLRSSLAPCGALVMVLVFAGATYAADGAQFSRDCAFTYVNKKVGENEQWAITWEIGFNASGNVFMLDGSPAAQIECEWVDENDTTTFFDCFGSAACTGPPCGGTQWTQIATNLAIPTAFFLPPGVDPLDPEASCVESF